MKKKTITGLMNLSLLLILFGCVSLSEDQYQSNEQRPENKEETKSPSGIIYNIINFSDLQSRIASTKQDWSGYIVETYVKPGSNYMYQVDFFLSEIPFEDNDKNQYRICTAHDNDGVLLFKDLKAVIFENVLRKIDTTKVYKVYIAAYNSVGYITKIDGILSDEEVEKIRITEMEKEKEAIEISHNPEQIDRSLYKEVKVEEFSFNLVSGEYALGERIKFSDNFYQKPTGNIYKFKNIDESIQLYTEHNFVVDIPGKFFTGFINGNYVPMMTTVSVYVTIKQIGVLNKCSIDIVDWW